MATDQNKEGCCGTGCCTPADTTIGVTVDNNGLPIVPEKTEAELEAELATVDAEESGSILR